MDISKALTFFLKDDRWLVKLLVGTIILFFSFLIIPSFFFIGYMVELVRNVMDDVDYPLPEWDNWGQLFKEGFALFLVGLVYTIPVWLLMCCSLLLFIPGAALEGELSNAFVGMGIVAIMALTCLMTLFLVAYALISPALTIQYTREEEIAACFRLNEIAAITRNHIGDVLLSLVVIFGLSMVLSLVFIVPILGWFVAFGASVYLSFVMSHLYGQIGAKIEGNAHDSGITGV